MRQESLNLIEQIQNRYSNAIQPLLYKNFTDDLDGVVRQIAAYEAKLDIPININIENSEFVQFIVDVLFPHVTVTFTKCRAEFIVIEKEHGNLNLIDCKFTNIESRKSLGGANLTKCTAEAVKVSGRNNLNINKCNIQTINFNFEYADISGVLISSCNFNLIFSGGSRENEIKINNCNFYGCTIENIELKIDFKFGNNVDFFGCVFTRTTSDYEVIYRKFKKDFQEHRHENLFNLFGSLELECHHSTLKLLRPSINYFLSSMYNYLNRFGLDPYRPFMWLGVLFSIAVFVWSLNIFVLGPFEVENKGLKINEIEQFFYLSFVSILGPLKALGIFSLLKIQTLLAQTILFVFNLISSLLWFFLILAIRKRFRVSV